MKAPLAFLLILLVVTTAAAGESITCAEGDACPDPLRPLLPSGNTVDISGSALSFTAVYGGYSDVSGTEVSGNTVYFNAGSVSDLYGGRSTVNGTVSSNTIILNAQNAGTVYGGHSQSGSAIGNHVVINGSNKAVNIYGGRSQWAGDIISVRENSVTLNNGNITSTIYGGIANGHGIVSDNSIFINGGVVGKLFGGHARYDDVLDNVVTVTGGTVRTDAAAGYTMQSGNIRRNAIYFTDAEAQNLYGGYAATAGDVSDNSVISTGGTVRKNIYGGRSDGNGNVFNNIVVFENGTVQGNIYGGYSTDGDCSGNTVFLRQDIIDGNVYGGYAAGSGATEGNTVILAHDLRLNSNTRLFGGNKSGDNTLLFAGDDILLLGQRYASGLPFLNNFSEVRIAGGSGVLIQRTAEFDGMDVYIESGASLTFDPMQRAFASIVTDRTLTFEGPVNVRLAQPLGTTGMYVLASADGGMIGIENIVFPNGNVFNYTSELTAFGELIVRAQSVPLENLIAPDNPKLADIANSVTAGYNRAPEGSFEKEAFTHIVQTLNTSLPAGERALQALGPDMTRADADAAASVLSQISYLISQRPEAKRDRGRSGGSPAQAFSVWGAYLHGHADQYSRENLTGYRRHTDGFVLGADVSLEHLQAGAALSYAQTRSRSDVRASDIGMYGVLMYAFYEMPRGFYLSGAAGSGFNRYHERQNAAGYLIRSEHNGRQDEAFVELGKDFDAGFLVITPKIRSEYIRLHYNDYRDSIGQRIRKRSYDTLTFESGFGLKTVPVFGITPELSLAASYEAKTDAMQASGFFLYGTPYVMTGTTPERWGGEAAFSLTKTMENGTAFSLAYQGNYKRRFDAHALLFQFRKSF